MVLVTKYKAGGSIHKLREMTDALHLTINEEKAKTGNSSKKLGKVRDYTGRRVRKYIRKKRQKAGYGYREYPATYLYRQDYTTTIG